MKLLVQQIKSKHLSMFYKKGSFVVIVIGVVEKGYIMIVFSQIANAKVY